MKSRIFFLLTTFCVLAPAQAALTRTVPLSSAAMVYSPSRGNLYVAVPDHGPQRARSITIVNPVSAAMGQSLFLSAEPRSLALSSDQRYLYVGLLGGNIVRVDLNSFTPDLTFSTLPTGVDFRVPVTIRVFPNQPTSIVAAVGEEYVGPEHVALAVFDNGVMRPKIMPPGTGVVFFDFGKDASTIWGYESDSSSRLREFRIDEQGISRVDSGVLGLVAGYFPQLVYRNDLIYTSSGRVFDPVRKALNGSYYGSETEYSRSFAIDWERSKAYFAARTTDYFSAAEYDLGSYRLTRLFRAPYPDAQIPWTPEQTVLCGSSILAFGGFGAENPHITLVPTALFEEVEWRRPPAQPINDQVRRIPIPINGIIYDPLRNLLYASAPNWAGDIANSVVPIDPVAGRVGEPVWVGPDPWQMAISDQGEYLYTGLFSGWAVRRVRLADMRADLRVPLLADYDWAYGRLPTRAADILTIPGSPDSFVVARSAAPGAGSAVAKGVAVFDGAVQRPKTTSGSPPDEAIYSLQWSSRRSVYAFPNFRELSVDPQGVEVIASTPNLTSPAYPTGQMRCQYDLCFTPSGVIIDASTQEALGRFKFDIYADDFQIPEFLVTDLDRGTVYFLSHSGRRYYGARTLHLEAYDVRSFLRIGSLKIEDAGPPNGFLLWGGNQLAVSTGEELILLPVSKLHPPRPTGAPPTVAGLRPPARLVFPFIEQDYRRFTGFAVFNAAPKPVSLRLTAYNADGDPQNTPPGPESIELGSGRQWARLGNEIFSADTLGIFWFELASEEPSAEGFFLYQHGDGLDGATAQREPAREIYFPRITTGENRFRGETAVNTIYLVNPNGFEVQVKLTVFGSVRQPGNAPDRTSWRVTLPPFGMQLEDLRYRSFFSFADYLSAHAKAEVTSERGGIIGFQLIKLEGPETLAALNATVPDATGRLYSAQLASGDRIFTSLKLVNAGAETRLLTLSAVGEDGSNLAPPVSLSLAAGESLESDADELFGWPTARRVVGSLKVEADGPGLMGNVLFGDPRDLRYASAVPLESRLFRRAVFSHVANVPNFFTGLALFNPGEDEAAVTLQVYSAEGLLTGETAFTLRAGGRLSRLLPEIVPSSAGQAGGYVLVRSSQPLVGQQLFGNTSLTHLSAVPAQILE